MMYPTRPWLVLDDMTACTENLGEHSDEITAVLCGCSHQNMVFQKRQKLRCEWPAFNDLLFEPGLIGLSFVRIQQPYAFVCIRVKSISNLACRDVCAILK